MNKKRITLTAKALTFLILIILIKFWIGVYQHDEFDEKGIFIKHRPIWKTYFYSPRGMSDLKLSDMNHKEREEQLLFDEFILKEKVFLKPAVLRL